MTGSEIVQIVSLFLTAIVSIISLLVRARIIALEGEITKLTVTLYNANVLVLSQGKQIEQLSDHIIQLSDQKTRKDKPQDYQGSPPYKPAK